MAGGSLSLAAMSANVVAALVRMGAAKGCTTFSSDIKVWIAEEECAVYPDAALVCGKVMGYNNSDQMITNPRIIVEVLSPSTRDYDLGRKFAIYKKLASLKEYILIEPDEVYVIHYAKDARGSWRKKTHQLTGALVELPSLNAKLALRDLYPNA
jgi:Uma2 family endonuclease